MSTTRNIRGTALAAAATLLLGGCANTVPVKDVHANTGAYLQAHFTPGQMREPVQGIIHQYDSGTVNFQKMHVQETVHFKSSNGDKNWTATSDMHFSHAGGPYVMERSEVASNGIPLSDNFTLSYRGLISLKSQNARLSSTVTSFPVEIKLFKEFSALPPGTPRLVYNYMVGTGPQLFNFNNDRDVCSVGAPFAATTLNATLQGQARSISCDHYNNNGAKTGTWTYAYMDTYGMALLTHVQDASGSLTRTIDSIEIH